VVSSGVGGVGVVNGTSPNVNTADGILVVLGVVVISKSSMMIKGVVSRGMMSISSREEQLPRLIFSSTNSRWLTHK